MSFFLSCESESELDSDRFRFFDVDLLGEDLLAWDFSSSFAISPSFAISNSASMLDESPASLLTASDASSHGSSSVKIF